jgi:hypothetical protein
VRAVRVIIAILLTSSIFAAEKPGAESLGQPELQEAFKILRTRFVRSSTLNYDVLNQAALSGLLERLGDGASLVPAKPAKSEETQPVAFFGEVLAPKLGYLRLAEYSMEELTKIEATMAKFREAGVESLIIDLRVAHTDPDLTAASRFLDRFVPPDTMLFRIQRQNEKTPQLFISQQAPQRWKGGLILLIDGQTCSAGELIAATILRNYPAFAIGEQTPGRTVEYAQVPLNDHLALRFADAEILLPDDSSLFQKGIQPAYVVAQPMEQKQRVFEATAIGPLSKHVFETSRPRLNEAALVHETDPELDYHLAHARGETTPFDVIPLQDKVLQRAIDLVLALRRIDTPAPPPAKSKPVDPAAAKPKPQGKDGM